MSGFVSDGNVPIDRGNSDRIDRAGGTIKVEQKKNGQRNNPSRKDLLSDLFIVPNLKSLVNSTDERLQKVGRALQIITAYSNLAFEGYNKLNLSSDPLSESAIKSGNEDNDVFNRVNKVDESALDDIPRYDVNSVFGRILSVILPNESYSNQYEAKREPALEARQKEIVRNKYIPLLKATYGGSSNKLINAFNTIEVELKTAPDIKTYIAKSISDSDLSELADELNEKGFGRTKPTVKIPPVGQSLEAEVTFRRIQAIVNDGLPRTR